jgi:hypothetical protein
MNIEEPVGGYKAWRKSELEKREDQASKWINFQESVPGKKSTWLSYRDKKIIQATKRFPPLGDFFDWPFPPTYRLRTGARALRAVALYTLSSFAHYHRAARDFDPGIAGLSVAVKKSRRLHAIPSAMLSEADLELPMPFPTDANLGYWNELHKRFVEAIPDVAALARLHEELNEAVYALLGLRDCETVFVDDYIEYENADPGEAPSGADVAKYLKKLKSELDPFVAGTVGLEHGCAVVEKNGMPILRVDLRLNGITQRTAGAIYSRKKMVRAQWLPSRAILDAGEIIASILTQGKPPEHQP